MNPIDIAATAARITVWHASLPTPKPQCFTCPDLITAIGQPMRALHGPLTLLGWTRGEVWHRERNRRVKRVLWAAPGCSIPRPPRGRPRFNLADYVTINIL